MDNGEELFDIGEDLFTDSLLNNFPDLDMSVNLLHDLEFDDFGDLPSGAPPSTTADIQNGSLGVSESVDTLVSILNADSPESRKPGGSTTLESLLKSVPTTYVPPAPQFNKGSPISAQGNGRLIEVKDAIFMLQQGQQAGSTVSDNRQYYGHPVASPAIVIAQREAAQKHVQQQQPTIIGRLLKSEQEVPSTNGSVSLSCDQQTDAAYKLQLIRKLLDGSSDTLVGGHLAPTTTSPPTTNSAPCVTSSVGGVLATEQQLRQILHQQPVVHPAASHTIMDRQQQPMVNGGSHVSQASATASAPTLTATLASVSSLSYANGGAIPVRSSSGHSLSSIGGGGADPASSLIISQSGGVGKTVRRSSHNVIEKRYRLSINGKIDELRDMLSVADESKMNKSSVLKKAVERIRQLERDNGRLRDEVLVLRSRLGERKGSGQSLSSGGLPATLSPDSCWSGQSEFSTDSPAGSPVSSHSSHHSVPQQSQPLTAQLVCTAKRKAEATVYTGQKLARLLLTNAPTLGATTARITLCMVACTLFVISPLNYLPGGSSAVHQRSSHSPTSRHILESPDTTTLTPIWLLGLSYFAQWSVALWLLWRAWSSQPLLPPWLSGQRESSVPVSGDGSLVQLHWSKAEQDLANGAWLNALAQLKACLVSLGRPMPTRRFDWLVQTWIHLLGLLPLVGGGKRAEEEDKGSGVGDGSKKDKTTLCHVRSRILQMAVLDLIPLPWWSGLQLALATLSSLQECRNLLTSEDKAELYICLGLAAKKYAPVGSSWLSSWFNSSALALVQSNHQQPPISWDWLRSEVGYLFLSNYSVADRTLVNGGRSELGTEFTTPGRSWSLLDKVRSDLRDKLMTDVLEALASGDAGQLDTALALLSRLACLCEQAGIVTADDGTESGCAERELDACLLRDGNGAAEKRGGADRSCLWWCTLGRVACHWSRGQLDSADLLHEAVVTRLPTALIRHRERVGAGLQRGSSFDGGGGLADGVLVAYRVQRRALMGSSTGNRDSGGLCAYLALRLANQATAMLKEVITRDSDRRALLWSVLACDWLLTARASLGSSCEDDLVGFSAGLAALRAGVQRARLDPRKWMVLHEATYRVVAGGNPLHTSLLLRQSPTHPTNVTSSTHKQERGIRLVQELIRARAGGAANGIRSKT